MKNKLFATLMLCVSTVAVFGQGITFHQGEKSWKKPTQKVDYLLPADADGQMLSVEYELNITGKVKAVRVRQIDGEWNETAMVKIDDTRESYVNEAFRKGDRIHLLLGKWEKKGYKMRHVVVSASGLKVVTDSLLLDISQGKGEELYIKTALSPEKKHVALVYTVWNEKSNQSHATAMLFDGNMRKQFGQPLWYGDVSQIIVTDRGTVATACLLGAKDHQSTLLRMNVIDAYGRKQDEVVLKGDLEQVALLNYTSGKLLCTALEGEGGHGLWGKRQYVAFHTLLYDMNASTLKVGTRHAFTREEIATFENVDTDTKVSSKSSNFILRLNQTTTPGGGAVIYQRKWKMSTYKNGMEVSSTIHRKGMLVVNVDTLGNILWVRGIMQNNQHAGEIQDAPLLYHNGKLYVFTNESKDETSNYTPQTAAKHSKSLLMANAALAAYCFTADGQGSKQMLETEEKGILQSPLFDFGGGKYILLTGGNTPKISSITIP